MILQLSDFKMLQYVTKDISETLRLLPVAIGVGMALLILRCLLFCNNVSILKHLPVRMVFLMYLLMLAQITLLTREPGSRTDMNLRLFGTLGDARANAYVMENLLLFIPYGALLPLAWRRARWGPVCILVGVLISVGI